MKSIAFEVIQMEKITQIAGVLNYVKQQKSVDQLPETIQKPSPFELKVVPAEDRLSRLTEIFGDKALKQMGIVECQTCSSRTYVDGSDDPGVSFKTPTGVSPEASFAAVSAHEQEHVTNEQQAAHAEGREVIAQSVQVFMSVCPECGKAYASGGVTKTTTASKAPYKNPSMNLLGNLIDAKG